MPECVFSRFCFSPSCEFMKIPPILNCIYFSLTQATAVPSGDLGLAKILRFAGGDVPCILILAAPGVTLGLGAFLG